ncbi:VWA domain-containing protein [bacterium]|jgi:hypothetical protein|nr:VWA domain-containing protein [bacterium]
MGTQLLRLSAVFAVVSALFFSGCGDQKQYLYPLPRPGEPVVLDETIQSFVNSGFAQLDIVWVIDNSPSMQTYQNQVIDNTALFLKEFTKKHKQLDWRMGLISTDLRNEPFIGFEKNDRLDSTTSNNENRFKEAVAKLGTNGDANERMFRPLENVIHNFPHFFRPGAALAIILMTDTDDDIQGDPSTLPQLDPLTVARNLMAFKGSAKQIFVYGVIGAPDVGGCSAESGSPFSFYTSRYSQFFNRFQNKVYPACSPKFGQNLAEMSQDIVSRVGTFVPRIVLPSVPDPATIRLEYDGKILPGGDRDSGGFWTFEQDENMIYFPNMAFTLEKVEQVRIKYISGMQQNHAE